MHAGLDTHTCHGGMQLSAHGTAWAGALLVALAAELALSPHDQVRPEQHVDQEDALHSVSEALQGTTPGVGPAQAVTGRCHGAPLVGMQRSWPRSTASRSVGCSQGDGGRPGTSLLLRAQSLTGPEQHKLRWPGRTLETLSSVQSGVTMRQPGCDPAGTLRPTVLLVDKWAAVTSRRTSQAVLRRQGQPQAGADVAPWAGCSRLHPSRPVHVPRHGQCMRWWWLHAPECKLGDVDMPPQVADARLQVLAAALHLACTGSAHACEARCLPGHAHQRLIQRPQKARRLGAHAPVQAGLSDMSGPRCWMGPAAFGPCWENTGRTLAVLPGQGRHVVRLDAEHQEHAAHMRCSALHWAAGCARG